MLCCLCKKNQATKTFVRGRAGKQKEEYYCFECYRSRFLSVEFDGEENGRTFEVCPYCNTKAEDFKRTTLVGCAKCYQTIGKAVLPVLINMQGGEVHAGKEGTVGEEALRLRLQELKILYESYLQEGNEQRAREIATEFGRLQAGDKKGVGNGTLT